MAPAPVEVPIRMREERHLTRNPNMPVCSRDSRGSCITASFMTVFFIAITLAVYRTSLTATFLTPVSHFYLFQLFSHTVCPSVQPIYLPCFLQDNTTLSINASYNAGDLKQPIFTFNIVHSLLETEDLSVDVTRNATEPPRREPCSIAMANANKSADCNYLTLLARGFPRFPGPPPSPPTNSLNLTTDIE